MQTRKVQDCEPLPVGDVDVNDTKERRRDRRLEALEPRPVGAPTVVAASRYGVRLSQPVVSGQPLKISGHLSPAPPAEPRHALDPIARGAQRPRSPSLCRVRTGMEAAPAAAARELISGAVFRAGDRRKRPHEIRIGSRS